MELSKRDMLKKLLGIFGVTVFSVTSTSIAASPAEDALLRQIAERSKTDPLIGAKIGSKEITQRLLTAMKEERGVHIESILCSLGSLAGYACQASVRAQAVTLGLTETANLVTINTKEGKQYFFGDHLNKPLAESQYSVWGLVGGAAQHAGCATMLNVDEIFKHVSETVGSGDFGKPRVSEKHMPHDLPLNYVRNLWPSLLPIIQKFCPNPEHWPILLGLSIQEVIEMGKQVLDPCTSAQLVMESAIPMSKVDIAAKD